MLSLLHIAKCRGDISDWEDAMRHWLEFAFFKFSHYLVKKCAEKCWFLAHHSIQIDGEEREVLLERLKPNSRVLINIAFADFQKSSILRECGNTFGNCFPSQ